MKDEIEFIPIPPPSPEVQEMFRTMNELLNQLMGFKTRQELENPYGPPPHSLPKPYCKPPGAL